MIRPTHRFTLPYEIGEDVTAFLITMATLMILGFFGRLIWLVKGEFPLRTPNECALDLVLNVALAFWAIYLLVTV